MDEDADMARDFAKVIKLRPAMHAVCKEMQAQAFSLTRVYDVL